MRFFDLFNYELTPMVGAGVIHRDSSGSLSIELTLELAHRITDWLSINIKSTLMQRSDLSIYGDDASSFRPWDWKPNLYGGLKIYLN